MISNKTIVIIVYGLMIASCAAPRESSFVGELETPTDTNTPLVPEEIIIPGHSVKYTPDLETYYLNPGIGWQNAHTADEIAPPYAETVYYPVRTEITWKILNPAEGVYDWTEMDARMDLAVREGKQFSFNVFSMLYPEQGHTIPNWAIDEGIALTSWGDPDYTGCVYQNLWGGFVNALLERYDGNPNVAFIDITGYGDFNEWGWQDNQTEWDEVWYEAFNEGIADSTTMVTLDSQARRRLADMFIGGSYKGHLCRDVNGEIVETDYSYRGAQHTQMVMPFAGIPESTQYVFLKRPDVGFRYNCLGRPGGRDIMTGLIGDRWKYAPVVFEICGEDIDVNEAIALLKAAHGSIVHHNNDFQDLSALHPFVSTIGYRFYLESAAIDYMAGRNIYLSMIWKNIGNAPNYPKMGQVFEMHVYLVDEHGVVVEESEVSADTSKWLPDEFQNIKTMISLPETLQPGSYSLEVSFIDTRTNLPIYLAFGKPTGDLKYLIATFEYK